MVKFLLVAMLVGQADVTPVMFVPFETRAQCEKAKVETLRRLGPPTLSFVMECVTVRRPSTPGKAM